MSSAANLFSLCSADTKLTPEQLAKAKMIEARLYELDKNIANIDRDGEVSPAVTKVIRPQVFVRVRPSNEAELLEGKGIMSGLHSNYSECFTSEGCQLQLVGPTTGSTHLNGFRGVFGEEIENDVIFERTLAPHIQEILAGSSVQLFCYGHTGTGKTHTMMGYGSQVGLYRQAAERLLAEIGRLNEENAHSVSSQMLHAGSEDRFLLQVTFAEVYLDRVFDLISGRQECSLREDANGGLHIRASTDVREDGAVYVQRQHRAVADNIDTIMSILHEGIALRAVGSSSLHDQSSRSHAVMRMEVVSSQLLAAREAVEHAEARVHPIGKEKTDVGIAMVTSLLNIAPVSRAENDESTKLTYVATRKCDSGQMSVDEWLCLHEELITRYVRLHRDLEVAMDAQARAEAAEASIAAASAPIAVGGSLTLVDLAGADHDTRDLSSLHSATERSESNKINSSLLALKECMRGLGELQSTPNKRLPFRDSKLTRLLKPILLPISAHKSPSAGPKSVAVMIATVSPSVSLEKATCNTLRYAQMVTGIKAKLANAGVLDGTIVVKSSPRANSGLSAFRIAQKQKMSSDDSTACVVGESLPSSIL